MLLKNTHCKGNLYIHTRRECAMELGKKRFGRPLMHHQNVSLQNAPSKRNLLTSLKRSLQDHPSLERSKKYVLMAHFAVIRFDGASGACQEVYATSVGSNIVKSPIALPVCQKRNCMCSVLVLRFQAASFFQQCLC